MDVGTEQAIVRWLLEFWNAYMGKSMVLNGIELWDQQALASVADGDGVGAGALELADLRSAVGLPDLLPLASIPRPSSGGARSGRARQRRRRRMLV